VTSDVFASPRPPGARRASLPETRPDPRLLRKVRALEATCSKHERVLDRLTQTVLLLRRGNAALQDERRELLNELARLRRNAGGE
jgi:hypothetical protein